MSLDLSTPRRIHVIGVGGPGMNPIAAVLAAQGHRVSGSDLKESSGLVRLRSLGVEVFVGHDESNVQGVDVVVRSTAVPDRNIEVQAAHAAGIPVLARAAALRAISQLRRTVSVAGTHGKTTTTSMLAMCLVDAALQPSFIVGGDVNDIGSGAVWEDDGSLFVVEADESDGTFEEIVSGAAIVTNLERDHLEFHGSFVVDTVLGERIVDRIAIVPEPGVYRLGNPNGHRKAGPQRADVEPDANVGRQHR